MFNPVPSFFLTPFRLLVPFTLACCAVASSRSSSASRPGSLAHSPCPLMPRWPYNWVCATLPATVRWCFAARTRRSRQVAATFGYPKSRCLPVQQYGTEVMSSLSNGMHSKARAQCYLADSIRCTKDAPKDISNGSAIYLRKGDSTLVESEPLTHYCQKVCVDESRLRPACERL